MTILLVAGKTDAEARRVAEELRQRRADVSWLDAVSFPEALYLTHRNGDLLISGTPCKPPEAAFLRALAAHPLMLGGQQELEERPRGFVAQCEEKRAFLESLLLTLECAGTRLVNSLEANRQHSCKPLQLYLLQQAGLPVPQWMASNHPRAVRAFVKQTGPCIYKPLAGGATVRMVDPADLSDARMAALALAPVLFQEYCGGVSVRAYVAGRRVIAAAEIHSGEIDYRRDEQDVRPTRLTVDEREASLAAARACNMPFTGVDLIRGADGFHLLECNPAPMFAVFEKKTDLDVAGPLAALLMQLEGSGPVKKTGGNKKR